MATPTAGQGQSPDSPRAPEGEPSAPEGMLAVAAVAMVLALAFTFTVLVVGRRDDGRLAVESTGPTETVAIELGDFYVKPGQIEVPAGTRLAVDVTNKGDLAHDLNLDGETGTDRLQPGDSQVADLGVIDADAEAWCTVPGHKEQGMLLTITVVEPQGPPGGEPPGGAPPGGEPPGGEPPGGAPPATTAPGVGA